MSNSVPVPSLPLLITAFLKPHLHQAGPFDLRELRRLHGKRPGIPVPTHWYACMTPTHKRASDAYRRRMACHEGDVFIEALLVEGEAYCRTYWRPTETPTMWPCVQCGKIRQHAHEDRFRDYIVMWNAAEAFHIVCVDYDKRAAVEPSILDWNVDRNLSYREVWTHFGPKPFLQIVHLGCIDLELLIQHVVCEVQRIS